MVSLTGHFPIESLLKVTLPEHHGVLHSLLYGVQLLLQVLPIREILFSFPRILEERQQVAMVEETELDVMCWNRRLVSHPTLNNNKWNHIWQLFWCTTFVRYLYLTNEFIQITLSSEFNVAIDEATSISTRFVSTGGVYVTGFIEFTVSWEETGFLKRGCQWWMLMNPTFLVEYRSRSRPVLKEVSSVLRFSEDLATNR